jgi:tripartite-type tricarboxylate transporter receptor subunit TctC
LKLQRNCLTIISMTNHLTEGAIKPLIALSVALGVALLMPEKSLAQATASTYPTKPIALVVGYTPGGSVDLAARIIAPELSKRLGQPVIVENTAGASGGIATQRVISGASDGHLLLLGTSAEVTVLHQISKTVKYNGLTDLAAVYMIGTQPSVLVGSPNLPFKTTDELLAGLKKSPGKFSYGSPGNGSLPHLTGEFFKQLSSTYVVHVPYRGASPMISDLMGSNLDLGLLLLSSAIPHIKSGKLKAFGVTQPNRATQIPEVPALPEFKGLKDLDIGVFFGVFANSKMPAEITARLSKELAEVLKQADIRTKLTDAGFSLKPLDSAQAKVFVEQQAATYKRIIERSKITE